MLRTVVMPRLYHQLALGIVTIGALKKVDRLTRNALRKWLTLAHDTSNAYFHAAVKDGGIGVPSMKWTAPVQRRLLAVQDALGHQELRKFELRKNWTSAKDDSQITGLCITTLT